MEKHNSLMCIFINLWVILSFVEAIIITTIDAVMLHKFSTCLVPVLEIKLPEMLILVQ